ncbi:MAG: DUF1015 domain-containing protein [Acidobacteria bacterium]|nr:DUF1015 domain-containing protein [Acidobacteriota bacterium]
MARIFPFAPYRYTPRAGPLDRLATQPYDKITPEMRERYLAASPYNLVRIILGPPRAGDSPRDNPYTRAARYFEDWIAQGVVAREAEPGLFPYFQEFVHPDTGEPLVRKGFIGLSAVEDYSAGVVYRHEQTLPGPKKDRLELLRHTHAHFGQIFVLYSDPAGEVDRILEEAAAAQPVAEVCDEYGTAHRMWKIAQPAHLKRIAGLMSDKKLLIADGHHRYETALAFRNENPQLEGAARVMTTFVNMHSPGLAILATHRLVGGLEGFAASRFLEGARQRGFGVSRMESPGALKQALAGPSGVVGAAIEAELYLLQAPESWRGLDVRLLHDVLLPEVLRIGEEAVAAERNLRYVRGFEAAIASARRGETQIAFLLKPVTVEQVAEISFAGSVMPQKSTDFYPKLLSGLAIYRIGD